MIRKTLTILSPIGLLLSLGLWGASCYGPYYKTVSRFEGMECFADCGTVFLITWTGEGLVGTDRPSGWSFGEVFGGVVLIPWFSSQVAPSEYGMVQMSFMFLPLCIPVLILAILPLLAVRRIHRKRRSQFGGSHHGLAAGQPF